MPEQKTRVFIDFWNLQLTIKDHTPPTYRLDWQKISPLLVREASTILNAQLRFDGTTVYVSYNPRAPQDKALINWCTNTLDHFPGIRVVAKERKDRNAPTCPNCHQLVTNCPHCNLPMKRTIEKGIDTAIVTDMISLAWENVCDVAILVSSDRDFIPAVEFLTTKGRRVINAYFPPQGLHLARTCWGSIDLIPHLGALSR